MNRFLLRQLFVSGLVVFAFGCDDDSASHEEEIEKDGAVLTEDAAVSTDSSQPVIEEDAAPKSKAAWIEVSLSPQKSIYTFEHQPQATAQAYDYNGDPIDLPLEWRVEPEGMATLGDDQTLTLLGEGQGYVYACNEDTCGFSPFYVDDGLPVLNVYEPARGSFLGGDSSSTIRVSGTAADSGGNVAVYVNDIQVDVGPGGTFSINIPAKFGLNFIEVKANDGVNEASSTDRRTVLWAPNYLRATNNVLAIGNAISLRIDQSLLDTDVVPDAPEGEMVLDEIAQVILTMLRLADVGSLLGDGALVQSEALTLSIDGIDLGTPEIDLAVVQKGIELFVRLPDVRLMTSGQVQFEGQQLSLDGYVSAGVAAFVSLELAVEGGRVKTTLSDIGIAIESISGMGLENQTAATLVSSLGSALRVNLLGVVDDMIQSAVGSMLPDLLQAGVDSAMDALASIPLNIDLNQMIGGHDMPSLALELAMMPRALTMARNETATLEINAVMTHAQSVTAPFDDPGVPALSEMTTNAIEGDGFGASIRLELINGLLHELWRAGLLEIDVSSMIPMGTAAISARLPPVVVPADEDSEYALMLRIGDLRLSMTNLVGVSSVSSIDLSLGLKIQAGTDENGKISFKLNLAEEPDIKLTIIEKTGEVAESSMTSTVRTIWNVVAGYLPEVMGFELDGIEISPSMLQNYIPRLQGLRLEPQFGEGVFVRDGRVRLEGGLGVKLTVGE